MAYIIGGAAQVGDLVIQAFLDLTVIQTGAETLTTAMQTDAFLRLNQIVDSLSAEGLTVPNQVAQTFNLLAGITAYTLGAAGTFATAGGLRVLKVTAWRAFYLGVLHSGGRVLSLAEFGEQAKQVLGQTTPIPGIVGADTAYPLINVRAFPPPSQTPGQLELDYLTPISNFASLTDLINLPQGWQNLLHWHLAQSLWPQYPRPGVRDTIWDMCQRTKQALLIENTMTAPQPQPAAPQGQQ